jgi:endonuclease/exonuclease/phosphatase family metal-dependent hydrolase
MKKAMDRKSFLKNAGLLSAVPLLSSLEGYPFARTYTKSSTLKVMTCNIRVDLDEDRQKGVGWESRKDACVKVIQHQRADIIGFQEVLKNQFLDLKSVLKDYYGLGFDGPEMDMYSEGYHGIAKNPIFFSKSRFFILAAGGYWLSETPLEAGSMSWGSARARHINWVRLYDKSTKQEFRFLNTHLDHVSNEAKLGQIKMIIEEAAQYRPNFPQILVGDFNSRSESPVIQEVLSSDWLDSYLQVHGESDPGPTTHDFTGPNDPKKDKRKKIDFIFIKGGFKASDSTIIRDSYKDVYPSDHYFVDAVLHF